jgi:hypothetical protein
VEEQARVDLVVEGLARGPDCGSPAAECPAAVAEGLDPAVQAEDQGVEVDREVARAGPAGRVVEEERVVGAGLDREAPEEDQEAEVDLAAGERVEVQGLEEEVVRGVGEEARVAGRAVDLEEGVGPEEVGVV